MTDFLEFLLDNPMDFLEEVSGQQGFHPLLGEGIRIGGLVEVFPDVCCYLTVSLI